MTEEFCRDREISVTIEFSQLLYRERDFSATTNFSNDKPEDLGRVTERARHAQ